jgi:hypothetical protein
MDKRTEKRRRVMTDKASGKKQCIAVQNVMCPSLWLFFFFPHSEAFKYKYKGCVIPLPPSYIQGDS